MGNLFRTYSEYICVLTKANYTNPMTSIVYPRTASKHDYKPIC